MSSQYRKIKEFNKDLTTGEYPKRMLFFNGRSILHDIRSCYRGTCC